MLNVTAAAQSVLDAFLAEWPDEALEQDRKCLAAALRAVADVVAPEVNFYGGSCCERELKSVRGELLAIADELDGIKYGTYRCNLENKT